MEHGYIHEQVNRVSFILESVLVSGSINEAKLVFAEDGEKLAWIRSTLYTPVIGDVLDTLGYWHQFLPQSIQPLSLDMRITGRAMPVQIADAWGKQDKPFGRMTEALDAIRPNEIYVATGGSLNCAAWGEIMTAAARSRGWRGRSYRRFSPRYQARYRTGLACLQPRSLCAGCGGSLSGCRFPLSGRDRWGSCVARRPDRR